MNHRNNQDESPWILFFDSYDPKDEKRREVIFALGNGVLVTRAAAVTSRAGTHHYPGTYRAGCYEDLRGDIDGRTDETESLVNLPNWLPLTFRIDDDDNGFHLDAAHLEDYRHTLDLKTGIACRSFTHIDRQGRRTDFHEQRLTSMARPHLAALRVEITPLNWSGLIELCSGIDGTIVNANVPRYADYEHRHFEVLGSDRLSTDVLGMRVRTRRSRIDIVEAMRTTVEAATRSSPSIKRSHNAIELCSGCRVEQNRTLAVEKVVAICTSDDVDDSADEDHRAYIPAREKAHVLARRALADAPAFATLRAEHEQAWENLWDRGIIETGHDMATTALRFHAFHVLQTVSPNTVRLDTGVPARGWHGEAYRGHMFWDDLFVFPFLNFRFPQLAKSLLLYRYRRLDAARAAARDAGFRGAMYPWRSARRGCEVTPHWQKNLLSGRWMSDPTRLQHHIGSAIALNIWRYYLATGDSDFLAAHGAEMILEIARFWASIAHYSPASDRYEIIGVIGPDEYHNSYPNRSSPGLDNNAYTNIMAVWTLCRALEVLEHIPQSRRDELIHTLNLTAEEFTLWDTISRRMRVVFHGDGIISQYEGFEKLREFHRDLLPPELIDKRVDWALEAIGETADAYQITKQADALTLFYLLSRQEMADLMARLGYRFDCDNLRRTAEYYLARTTHRSSLSRIVYAGALARVDPARSWELYQLSLETDLHALKGESITEGIHLGAMGGTLDVLQRCYLGMEACRAGLRIDPALPPELGEVHINLRYRSAELDMTASTGRLRLRSARHSGETIEVIDRDGAKTTLKPGHEIYLGKL